MTPERQRQKLAGQSSIACKVFEHVPIGDEWSPAQVAKDLHRATGSVMDMHVLKGCLMKLKDAGLVRMSTLGAFRREPVAFPSPPAGIKAMKELNAAASPEPAVSAIDLLAGVAKTLRAAAAEIEAAAIAIEEARAEDDCELQKFKQLQALLKGLA